MLLLRGGGERHRLLLQRDDFFDLRHRLGREQAHAALGHVVGHPAVAEHQDHRLCADYFVMLAQFVLARLGCAPGLGGDESLDGGVDPAGRGVRRT
jgi:hypothetical protein